MYFKSDLYMLTYLCVLDSHVKRDLYTSKETYLCQKRLIHMTQKRPIHVKKDHVVFSTIRSLLTCLGLFWQVKCLNCQRYCDFTLYFLSKKTESTVWNHNSADYWDIYLSKETYTYQKRPDFWKNNVSELLKCVITMSWRLRHFTCQKRPTHVKRDLIFEKTTCQNFSSVSSQWADVWGILPVKRDLYMSQETWFLRKQRVRTSQVCHHNELTCETFYLPKETYTCQKRPDFWENTLKDLLKCDFCVTCFDLFWHVLVSSDIYISLLTESTVWHLNSADFWEFYLPLLLAAGDARLLLLRLFVWLLLRGWLFVCACRHIHVCA